MSPDQMESRSCNNSPAAGTKASRSCETVRCEPRFILIECRIPHGSEPVGA